MIAPGVVHNGSPEKRFLLGEPQGDAAPRPASIAATLQASVPAPG